MQVARADSNETVKRANRANGYGDYEGVTALGGVAHAVWTDGRDLRRLREDVYTATLVDCGSPPCMVNGNEAGTVGTFVKVT